MKKVSQILREAKAIIGTPEKWCKFVTRNESG